MKSSQLAASLERLFPQEPAEQIARMTLLILNRAPDRDELADDELLIRAWNAARAVLDAAADQHAAVTDELEQLCGGDEPVRFHPDQVWTLLRAIKVQSQVLELYLPLAPLNQ